MRGECSAVNIRSSPVILSMFLKHNFPFKKVLSSESSLRYCIQYIYRCKTDELVNGNIL